MRALVLCLTVASLSIGCQQTAYRPAGTGQVGGYSAEHLSANRYIVTFQGTIGADAQVVSDFGLLRAAELAKAAGYGLFAVHSYESGIHRTYRGAHRHFVSTSIGRRQPGMSSETAVNPPDGPHRHSTIAVLYPSKVPVELPEVQLLVEAYSDRESIPPTALAVYEADAIIAAVTTRYGLKLAQGNESSSPSASLPHSNLSL